jgi:hypothetical protein
MASMRHDCGLPWVKYVAFSFLRIMAVYVIYCLACIGVKLIAAPGGPLPLLMSASSEMEVSKQWVAKISFVLLGGATFHLLLLLQSFIFNIYNMSMTVLCLEIEDRQNAKSEAAEINH